VSVFIAFEERSLGFDSRRDRLGQLIVLTCGR
jgi:hypothetical protein